MSAAPDRRPVVTGLGLVTAAGWGREATWDRLLTGARFLRPLGPDDGLDLAPSSDPTEASLPFAQRTGAPLPHDAARPCGAREGLLERMLLAAAEEALRHAGCDPAAGDPTRVGCLLATSKGDWSRVLRAGRAHHAAPATGPDPADFLGLLCDAPGTAVAERLGLRGPRSCPVSACATGAEALVRAALWLQEGLCDAVLAGSADASLVSPLLSSFDRLGVLAHETPDPAAAVRPFDRRRTGFLVGEGAAVFLLETRSAAAARGAVPCAALRGWSLAGDAAGMTGGDDDGAALARCATDALRRAGLAPDEVGALHLHGTATRANDRLEARAVHRLFGPRAGRIPAVAAKGSIGHLLGAAGSVETALTVLGLRDGRLPPVANLDDPDADLDLVRGSSRSVPHEVALKLSAGFGGHLVATVWTRPDHP